MLCWWKTVAEQRHGLQHLRRRELLAADRQNVMGDEGIVQGAPNVFGDGLREINSADFRARMLGQGGDLHDSLILLLRHPQFAVLQ